MPYSMRRNPDEWMKLVLECRKSGMSDRQWCNSNGISYYTFASAIKTLRRMNYEVPKSRDLDIHDLTIPKQDVVKVDIVSDIQPSKEIVPIQEVATHLDNSHMIEIVFSGNTVLRVFDSTDLMLLEKVIAVVRRSIC